MSCALTQGYSLDCSDGVGGIKEARLAEWASLSGSTLSAGTITAINMASGKKFWKYELPSMNKDFLTEKIQTSRENGTIFYEQELQISLRKLSATLRNEIRLLSQNRIVAIITDRNGRYWISGLSNGLEMEPSDASTGTGRGEFGGYILHFKGSEEQPMCEVSSSIIASITN